MLKPSRRNVLCAAAALALSPAARIFAREKGPFQIGACDWSIGLRQKLEALTLAKEVGLDGVQVSFDDVGTETDLRTPEARQKYQELSSRTGVAIASLAMGILNSRPYATDPESERWVDECVGVMPLLGQKIVLLAFFGNGDINGKPDLQQNVINRLKKVAPKAEKAGVVLGIESWLNVDDHLRILDAVGSPAVKVYYDTANMHKQGYDIYKEIRILGRERICEFHMKENGHLLGQGPIDFAKVRDAIGEIGFTGWLIIESSVPKDTPIPQAYLHNQKFLREMFA